MMPFDDYFSAKPDPIRLEKERKVAVAKALQAKAKISSILKGSDIRSESKLGKKLIDRVVDKAAETPEDFKSRIFQKQKRASDKSGFPVLPVRAIGAKSHCGFLPARKTWLRRRYNSLTKKYEYD